MRFSIKDVFVLVALCAVIFAAGAYVGFNGIFIFVSIVATVMTAFFVPFAAYATRRGSSALVPLVFIGFGACVMSGFVSMALLINAILLLILGGALAFLPRLRAVTVLELALGCAAAAMALATLPGRSGAQRFEALRAEFPVVSLTDRLKYESKNQVVADQTDLSDKVSARLANRERTLSEYHERNEELATIHDWNTEMFARSMGFGLMRMSWPYAEWLRKPPLVDVSFNAAVEPLQLWRMELFGQSESVQSMHYASEADFLNRDGFGAVIDGVSKVVGFIEHALHQSPRGTLKDPGKFAIERMELVSLLKHAEPRVYVLDHMPRMDQLSAADAPTRALDAFELDALKKLRADEDVVVSQDGNNYRMLGSLRATTECAQCHSVQRGELLGAFSYVIRAN